MSFLSALKPSGIRAALAALVVAGAAGLYAMPVQVSVAPLTRGEALRVAHAATTVEAVQRSEVKPRVQGTVAELLVREGDVVHKDQILARLTAPTAEMEFNRARRDISALDAQLSGVGSELAEARREQTRLAKLSTSGSISTAELERAKSRLAVLQAQLTGLSVQRKGLGDEVGARSSVTQQGAVSSRDLEVRSPMDGVVLRRGVDLGTFTTPAHTAFVVGTLDTLAVDAVVDETDIPYISRDTEVWLSFRVLPGARLKGRIVEIPQDASRDLQAFVVKVAIVDTAPALRPGMSGEAAFVLERHPDALLVPTASVTADHKVRFVQNGRMATLVVATGIVARSYTEILSPPAELRGVVLGPDPLPRDGARVRVQNAPVPQSPGTP